MIDPKFVGRTYGPVKYVVGLEKIREFANATGDTNPAYLDEEAAAKGPLGGIVAPPMFAVVYQKDMLGAALFDRELDLNLAMLVHGEQDFRFHFPARPGDVVVSQGRISHIERKDDKDIISIEVESKVGGRLLTTGTYTFVVRG